MDIPLRAELMIVQMCLCPLALEAELECARLNRPQNTVDFSKADLPAQPIQVV
jgi:hypothetical protein